MRNIKLYYQKLTLPALLMLIFAGGGILTLFGVSASTPHIAVEPETGVSLGNGNESIVDDATASNGKAVKFSATAATNPNEGKINFFKPLASAQDQYTQNPTETTKQWMRNHYTRGFVYSPYFDSRVSWLPNSVFYRDAYAIYTNSALATQRPEWILKDSSGQKLYISFACNGTTCTQYAADFGSTAWRNHYINDVKTDLAKGYLGVMVDDVNLDFRISNGTGNFVAPIDPRTGVAMTESNWRRYFAEFMEQLRAEVPDKEITHNSVWYAGGSARDADPYITRQIKAADFIMLERGLNDGGLTGGTGQWSIHAVFAYIDRLHSHGANIIFLSDAVTLTELEYNLAGYLLVNDGNDYVGGRGGSDEHNWWLGYDRNLGDATSDRYMWNGLYRRDFTNGMVLLNEPGATSKTVALGSAYTNTANQSVTSVTLGATKGAVLIR